MTTGLQQVIENAIEDLKDWMSENPGDSPSERITEIADESTPIMNWDILQCAEDDMTLALTEPEIGPAFDGTPTAINIIAACIYERLESELWEYYHDHEDDEEEENETSDENL